MRLSCYHHHVFPKLSPWSYKGFSYVLCLIAIVGDITPMDGISKAEKSRREEAALDHMCRVLGGGSRGASF